MSFRIPSLCSTRVLPGFLSFVHEISGPQVGYDELGSPFSTRSTESEPPALVETMLVSGCDWLWFPSLIFRYLGHFWTVANAFLKGLILGSFWHSGSSQDHLGSLETGIVIPVQLKICTFQVGQRNPIWWFNLVIRWFHRAHEAIWLFITPLSHA